MSRAHVYLTAVCVIALHSLTQSQVMAFEAIELDPTMIMVHVEPQDVEQARAAGENGSFVVGGHLGALPGCPGVQAFVKKVLASGATAWALSASADKDCDLDGLPDGGGDSMFADITKIDPAYILASTIYDTVYLPDRSTYVTGQYLIAWEDGDELTAVWAAFVLHLTPQGRHQADLYVGPQPTGPPAQVASYDALCAALGNTRSNQWGGRALAPVKGEADGTISGMALAGWRQSGADGDATDKNIFLTLLTPDFTMAKWFQLISYPGTDQPLDIAVGENRNVYATGYYGPDHDVFVACFDGQTGTLTHIFRGGGPLDDWGEAVDITGSGEILVEGKFTDTATFHGQTLVGEGLTDFRALLTPTLEPILIEVVGNEESGSGSPLKDGTELPPHSEIPRSIYNNSPNRVTLLVGTASSGTNPSLVATANGESLLLHGEQRPDHKKIEVVFDVPIHPSAPRLQSVHLELQSSYCTDLTVLLGGGQAEPGVFFEIGGHEICPLDKPKITVQIPTQIAEQELGYTASSQPSAPLQVLLSMGVHGLESEDCPICISTGADEEVDEIMVNSDEYP